MRGILLLIIVVSLLGLYFLGSSFNFSSLRTEITVPTQTTTSSFSPSSISSHIITMNVPAVDAEGKGVVTRLKVEARPGTGKVLVDINNLFFFVDTQNSIRVAQRVAQNFTRENVSNYDLIYSIETDAQIIEGPSAGAALTVVTIAAIDGKELNPEVSITGTIESDGSVGPVGGVDSKAAAAKESGISIFLVPFGQGITRNYKPIQKCEKIGPITYCTTDYKAEELNVSKSLGIQITEISNIGEALNYFIED